MLTGGGRTQGEDLQMRVIYHQTWPVMVTPAWSSLCLYVSGDFDTLCTMYRFMHPRLFTGRLFLRAARAYHSPTGLKSVSEQDVAHFANFLAPSSILSTLPPTSVPAADLDQYNNDWMGKYHGTSSTVLKPKSTKEVSDIVKYCWENRIGVVPQGGNTGLVGGSVPIKDELIVSLANMNKVRSFDPVSGILSRCSCPSSSSIKIVTRYTCSRCRMHSPVSHGLRYSALSHNAAGSGRQRQVCYQQQYHPLHVNPNIYFRKQKSCQIGGNVATNAGGLRLLRYGSLHGSVLGLEVVLPEGTILDQLSSLRKDNTGWSFKYQHDLHSLFPRL